MRLTACSLMPLKVPGSLGLNSIGSITTRPSDPYQVASKANRNFLSAASCLPHAINGNRDKGCKRFKSMFLDFSNVLCTLLHQWLLDQFTAAKPPNWFPTTLPVIASTFGQTRLLMQPKTTVVFFKVLIFHHSFSPFTLPMISLNHWLLSSAVPVRILKAFPL